MSPAESPVTKNGLKRIDEAESGEPTCNQTSGNAVICSDMQYAAPLIVTRHNPAAASLQHCRGMTGRAVAAHNC